MPFGLTNMPAAFQSFIQWVLCEYLDITCVVYLDDILIFSKMQGKHDLHVLQVLHVLDQHGLLASVNKCEFDKDALEYLGIIIGKMEYPCIQVSLQLSLIGQNLVLSKIKISSIF